VFNRLRRTEFSGLPTIETNACARRAAVVAKAGSYGCIKVGTAGSARTSKVSAWPGQGSGVAMRSTAMKNQLSNKRLEQTRREGVPASRAVFFSSPRSSTWCSAGTPSAYRAKPTQ